jgi:hypothetical protein
MLVREFHSCFAAPEPEPEPQPEQDAETIAAIAKARRKLEKAVLNGADAAEIEQRRAKLVALGATVASAGASAAGDESVAESSLRDEYGSSSHHSSKSKASSSSSSTSSSSKPSSSSSSSAAASDEPDRTDMVCFSVLDVCIFLRSRTMHHAIAMAFPVVLASQ